MAGKASALPATPPADTLLEPALEVGSIASAASGVQGLGVGLGSRGLGFRGLRGMGFRGLGSRGVGLKVGAIVY